MKKKKIDPRGRTRAIYLSKELDEKVSMLRKERKRSYSWMAASLIEAGIEHIKQAPMIIESYPIKAKKEGEQ
jgi:predicted DNA-binding protein